MKLSSARKTASDESEYMPVPVKEEDCAGLLLPVDSSKATLKLRVIAPSDLPPGYILDVTYDGAVVSIRVPDDGARKGETFVGTSCACGTGQEGEEETTSEEANEGQILRSVSRPRKNRTIGSWTDGMFDCNGPQVNHCDTIASWFCWGCVLGEVMKRMKLTWLGTPATDSQAKRTASIIGVLFVVFLVIREAGGQGHANYNSSGPNDTAASAGFSTLVVFARAMMLLFFLYIGIRTRMEIRRRSNIEGGCHYDCLAFYFCTCCAVAQMKRHVDQIQRERNRIPVATLVETA